ncbi:MAG: glycosyltransferase family 4 protein [Cyanobacteria bacterium P01_E01_bin.6]
MSSVSNTSPSLYVTMLGVGLDVMGGIASVESLIIEHCPDDVHLTHLSTFEYGSPWHKINVFTASLFRLVNRLTSKPIDVIYLHFAQRGSTWRAVVFIWLCKIFQKPIVLHAHASEFKLFFNGLPSWAQRIITTSFRQAERCIVLSDSWKIFYHEIVGVNRNRISVLFNPVKIPEKVPTRNCLPPLRFVFLGRIGERKGTFDLVNAIARLPKDLQKQCQLTIAGDGEIEKANELIIELGLTDCIQVLGWVNAEKRDELLADSHAFILPSYNEGLPMALLEAMGWELASIVTPVGGIPEVLTHKENGLLVEPGNIEELTQAIRLLLTDPNLRENLAKKARLSVKDLDILGYQLRLRETYQDAVNYQKVYTGTTKNRFG